MDKHYKQFYKVGCNRYYTLTADGDIYLATETTIPVRKLIGKKDMTQSLKLLRCTTPLLILFASSTERQLLAEENEGKPEELHKYAKLDADKLQQDIMSAYSVAIEEQVRDLERWYLAEKHRITELSENVEEALKVLDGEKANRVKQIRASNPIGNSINLRSTHKDKVIKALQSDHIFLYDEYITPSLQNAYFYNADAYGTLTVYQVLIVRGVTKTINTFIYDNKLLSAFFESVYKKDKKRGVMK